MYLLYEDCMKKPLQETILDLANSVLDGQDMFIVDVEVKGTSSVPVISIYVDTAEGGVNIDQCAKLSRELGFLIDSQELIEGKFTLNVSSPGLDRPLKDSRQYPKNVGRKASVKVKEAEAVKVLKGTLTEVGESGLKLETDKKIVTYIKWEDLLETKILPAF